MAKTKKPKVKKDNIPTKRDYFAPLKPKWAQGTSRSGVASFPEPQTITQDDSTEDERTASRNRAYAKVKPNEMLLHYLANPNHIPGDFIDGVQRDLLNIPMDERSNIFGNSRADAREYYDIRGNFSEKLSKGMELVPYAAMNLAAGLGSSSTVMGSTRLGAVNEALNPVAGISSVGKAIKGKADDVLNKYADDMLEKINPYNENKTPTFLNKASLKSRVIQNKIRDRGDLRYEALEAIENKVQAEQSAIIRKLEYAEMAELRLKELYARKYAANTVTLQQRDFVRDNPSFAAFLEDKGKLNTVLASQKSMDDALSSDTLWNEFYPKWRSSGRGIRIEDQSMETMIKEAEDAMMIGGSGQWDSSFGPGNYSSNNNRTLANFSTANTDSQVGIQGKLRLNLPGIEEATTIRGKHDIIRKSTAHELNTNFRDKIRDPNTMVLEHTYGSTTAAERVVSHKALKENPGLLTLDDVEFAPRKIDPNIDSKKGAYGLRSAEGNPDRFPFHNGIMDNLTNTSKRQIEAVMEGLPASKKWKIEKIIAKYDAELKSLGEEYHASIKANEGLMWEKTSLDDIDRNIYDIQDRFKYELRVLRGDLATIGAIGGTVGGGAYIVNKLYTEDRGWKEEREALISRFDSPKQYSEFKRKVRDIVQEKYPLTDKRPPTKYRQEYMRYSKVVEKELLEKYKATNEFKLGGPTDKPSQIATSPEPEGISTPPEIFNNADFLSGLKYVESSNGRNQKNMTKGNTASGKYQFLYSEIKHLPILQGVSRDDFIANDGLQNEIMQMAIDGKIKGRPGYNSNVEYITKKHGGKDYFNYRPDEVAALSHYIGRQGALNFLDAKSKGEKYSVSGKTNKSVAKYLKDYNFGIAYNKEQKAKSQESGKYTVRRQTASDVAQYITEGRRADMLKVKQKMLKIMGREGELEVKPIYK